MQRFYPSWLVSPCPEPEPEPEPLREVPVCEVPCSALVKSTTFFFPFRNAFTFLELPDRMMGMRRHLACLYRPFYPHRTRHCVVRLYFSVLPTLIILLTVFK